MNDHFNTNHIHLLINEHTLSTYTKQQIIEKINNLINFINNIYVKKASDNELTSLMNKLLAEQKSTAKIIVSKNNLLSKNLIKNMTTQKENMLQVIEISQLRLEAELKKLNETLSYPALKTDTTFFSKLFNILKVPFKSFIEKKSPTPLIITRKRINLTTTKLSSLERKKEDLSKEFSHTGTESLRYLNKITYQALLPANDTSTSHLQNLKNKITILKD